MHGRAEEALNGDTRGKIADAYARANRVANDLDAIEEAGDGLGDLERERIRSAARDVRSGELELAALLDKPATAG